jgi:hypothetical protein
VSSTIQGMDIMLGSLKLMIKISGINSHSRTSSLSLRFKLEAEGMPMNGSNLSSSKFQMIVQIGIGLRANLSSILETQIETP